MQTPNDPAGSRVDSYFKQAVTNFQCGNLPVAQAFTQNVLELAPDHADALHLAGVIHARFGQFEPAIQCFHRAINLAPRQPSCHSNLGFALHMLGRLNEARMACERAIQLKPDFADAHNMLGVILKDLGRLEEALAVCRRTVQIRPDFAEAHNTIGIILKDLRRPYEALAACTCAIQIKPNFAEAHNALAVILKELGRLDEALAACSRAIQIKPDFAEACVNQGSLLSELGRMLEGLKACERALKIHPNLVTAHYNRANILANIGQFDTAESSYRKALELKPDHAIAHSNLLFLLAADARLAPDDMLAQQKQWDHIHGAIGKAHQFAPRTKKELTGRRLRIGYISPDFRKHPVGYFFEPLLVAHNKADLEIFCYANHDDKTLSDAITQRLSNAAEHWRFVKHLGDHELAQLIRADGIDILVDLAGHTEGNRLVAFTYRPAPIQAMYLGYCASSGLESMDYWITDEVLHPPDTSEIATEQLYRLPRCCFSYQPPAEAPPVSARPNIGGEVVFGSFNHLSKLRPEVIDTWSQLLTRLPRSRLLLMDKYLVDSEVRQLLLQQFSNHGVASDQLILRAREPYEQYLSTYAEVDIVLDAFPRTGGTTTAEALWMGVPVVTLAGQRYVERISASKLTATGLHRLITYNRAEYVDTALALAHDSALRIQLRTELRGRMTRSPLCDGTTLARTMEIAFQSMWQNYLAEDKGCVINPATTE